MLCYLQGLAYYLGMLAYYWVLVTPSVAFIFGAYLYLSVNIFHVHYDEAFSSLQIPHHKGFSRIHITPEGDLHVYGVAIDQVCPPFVLCSTCLASLSMQGIQHIAGGDAFCCWASSIAVVWNFEKCKQNREVYAACLTSSMDYVRVQLLLGCTRGTGMASTGTHGCTVSGLEVDGCGLSGCDSYCNSYRVFLQRVLSDCHVSRCHASGVRIRAGAAAAAAAADGARRIWPTTLHAGSPRASPAAATGPRPPPPAAPPKAMRVSSTASSSLASGPPERSSCYILDPNLRTGGAN